MTSCKVVATATTPQQIPLSSYRKFVAIWDTGATGTVITQAVVDALGLSPTGMVQVHGVGGLHNSETYLLNVLFNDSVQIQGVTVTKGILPGGPNGDVLIGMDIITLGDFAVTNRGGVTTFSFQVPSIDHIDYVERHDAAKAQFAPPQAQQNKSRQQRRAEDRKAKKQG